MARMSKSNDDIYYIDEFSNNTETFIPATYNNKKYNEISQSCGMELSTKHRNKLEPLLETDNTNNPKPMYGPEIDDLDPNAKPVDGSDDKGIDDGLLPDEAGRKKPSRPGFFPSNIPNLPRVPGVVPRQPDLSLIPDVNIYQQKKIIAQGMMDLALISANASQLRYILETKGHHPYYYFSLILISISLFVQVVVGIGLIWNCRFNININSQMCKADRTNNWIVIGVFAVTILNVFILSFSIAEFSAEAAYTNCGSAVF